MDSLETAEKDGFSIVDAQDIWRATSPYFFDFMAKKKGFVTYSDNNKGAILSKGSVGNPSSTTISDVLLVDGLKHNLISISQLCDKGYNVSFSKDCCIIEHNDKKDDVFNGLRINNVCMLDLNNVSLTGAKCLVTLNEDS